MGHTLGGGMRTVRGAEGVVDIHFSQGSQLLGKGGIVLFLFLMEADVLQQHDLAILEAGSQRLGGGADHVIGHLHLHAQHFAEALGDGLEGILHVKLALGAAQVGAQDHSGAVLHQVLDGGQRATQPVFVGDDLVFVHGHVKIAADKHSLAFDLNVLDGFLRHNVHSSVLVNSLCWYCKARFRTCKHC